MLEISLSKIVKNYGFKRVLDEFSLDILKGERIALIGANGSGKSTLFKIICGIEDIDAGTVTISNNVSIGMLEQIPTYKKENITVREILTQGFSEIYKIEENLRRLEERMCNCTENELEKILKDYSRLQEKYESLGGYDINTKVSKICNGFKINEEMLDKEFNTLSGGEKSIVAFASLMINNPSILLLDEPTNHLDIDTLEWLEKYLKNYNGTVLISSHDRYFLDKVTTKTVLIERGKEEIFHGNYSYYLEENERRIISEFEDYKNQEKKIEAMKQQIKKLREWGERGDNPRFFRRAICIERKLEKLELLDKPLAKKELPLDFEIKYRSGKESLVVKDLDISIGENKLLNNINFTIKYGDRVCLMGKNGTGKSTLIKKVLANINNNNEKIKLGSNVLIGYIPQEIKFDNENITVLEEARKVFDGTETILRSVLSKFLFYGDNIHKRVGSLSGGEKVRLKLFELIQKKANFLILDEPTNHIDIDTKEMLEEALKEYKGTILFISHDRYFINKLANKILYIENKEIKEYVGNYDYYHEIKNKQNF